MAFIVDRVNFRTYDPERGLELFDKSSFSDGVTPFRIEGPGVSISFMASMIEAPITEAEKANLNISDAAVWCVLGAKPKSDWEKEIIAGALMAYKWGHGFDLRGNPTLVRFGRAGGLFHD